MIIPYLPICESFIHMGSPACSQPMVLDNCPFRFSTMCSTQKYFKPPICIRLLHFIFEDIHLPNILMILNSKFPNFHTSSTIFLVELILHSRSKDHSLYPTCFVNFTLKISLIQTHNLMSNSLRFLLTFHNTPTRQYCQVALHGN